MCTSQRSCALLFTSAALILFTSQALGSLQEGDYERELREKEAALKQPERLTVIAPKYLRPNSDYHVLVSLANSRTPASIDLQLIGAPDSDRQQVEAKSVLVNSDETQTVDFSIGDWPAAEYVLNVSAQSTDRSWNFSDVKPLQYQAKSYSAFIQTDKAIYKPGQTVQFRVLLLTPNLRPQAIEAGINVSVTDPRRNVIKEWQELSNYRGLLTLDMPLTEDPMLGDYTIRVSARGQQFSKQFTVAEYVLPTFDVTIQLPKYVTFNKSSMVASVRATYTYGKPVQGQASLTVQPLVRFYSVSAPQLEQRQYKARLAPDGTADFKLDLARDLGQKGDIFEREIEFFARVEEDLTGRKYNRTQSMRIYPNEIKIERLNKEETFKPGMSQLFQYKVAYQDDVPVDDNGPEVELTYKVLSKPIKTVRLRPQRGLIEHEFVVPAKVVSPQSEEHQFAPNQLEIEANYKSQAHHLAPMNAFHSESQQYLQIQLPQVRERRRFARNAAAAPSLNIDDDLKVRLLATEPVQQVTCQGLARGNVVWVKNSNIQNKTQLEFEVRLTQRMAPELRVICFYVRAENKELIADSTSVPVGGLAKNPVKLTPTPTESEPGKRIELGVATSSNALVGVLAVDQSVLLLKSGNDLSQAEVERELSSYGSADSSRSSADSFWPGSAGSARNVQSLFEEAHVVVLSNNLIYAGHGWRYGRPYGNYLYNRAYMMKAAQASPVSSIALDSLLLDHELDAPMYSLPGSRSQEPLRLRTEFPETWLWQNGTADARGQAKFTGQVPDTITTWQLSAFSLHEQHGLGLSAGDNRLRVFRPFFIKLNLPYSIIRGETISIQAVVFNYSKRPVRARVALDNRNKQFEFVEAANSVDEERLTNESRQTRSINIPAQEGASVWWLVKPLELGYVNVRVEARAELHGDAISKKLLVKPEGQVQHMNKAVLISLAAGSEGERARWRRNVSIEVPANAVEGSRKVFASAVGDIMGAGLSNTDDLLRLPYGCGEQNMVNLVPNIAILNYLQNTQRLQEPQRVRALRNIETGYQRELNYKRHDGSFSAFGNQDSNGSVWLTAYVLKSLQQARHVISVDERVLEGAAQFISRLAREDGSVEEVGMLHNKALASEAHSSGEQRSTYLTAYSMIALLQGPSGSEESRAVLERGLNFLERRLEGSASNYELAIIAYALQLAAGKRQPAADRAFEKLWSRARQLNDQTWWPSESQIKEEPKGGSESELEPSGEREVESVEPLAGESTDSSASSSLATKKKKKTAKLSAPPPLKPATVEADQSAHLFVPDGLSVEQTAWALLTTTKRLELERALPIVRWLVSQQNSRGGFASTQDTVLAIEALASFAEANALATNSNGSQPLALDVEFIYPRRASANSSTSSSALPLRRTHLDQLLVERRNALVLQQLTLAEPNSIDWVQVEASGVGSAVVQVSWQYNLLVSAERPAFYLNPILESRSNLNYLQLSVCTFWKGEGAASNMAVLEVELPSGFAADVEALSSVKREPLVKRVDTEEEERRVIIYLEQVTRSELCLTVPAHRSTKVANQRSVPVAIYDYYDRKQAARIFYEPPRASSCDICEPGSTCGERCASGKLKQASAGTRLVSLAEQRAKLTSSTSTPAPNVEESARSRLAPNQQLRASHRNSSSLRPELLLPLSSAYSALASVFKESARGA